MRKYLADLSNINYMIDLESKDITDAKAEAEKLITEKTAIIRIYQEIENSDEITLITRAMLFSGEPVDWQ